METTLLATKLYRPIVRQGRLARPHLAARLDQVLSRRLALVPAPAGFGKTTLVSAWLEGQPHSGWLSLDPADNDPARFLAYLTAAFQQIDGRIGRGAPAGPQLPSIEAAMTGLINDAATAGVNAVLVLDDYHLIRNRFVHEAMQFLIEHAAPGLHLVLISREAPPFPLARLRAQDEIVELRAADLRFTQAEAQRFFRESMHLALADELAEALEQRTEGWPAGLQLAALSLKGRDGPGALAAEFGGAHEYVLDFLVEEVLQRQPEAVQTFMVQTSVLDQLYAPLCNSVTWREDSQATLEGLYRDNLFVVPLDDSRDYFRYHHLFREALQARLLRTSPGLLPVLHRRAAQWYLENGQPAEAIHHGLQGEDYTWTAGVIEQTAESTLMRGEMSTVQQWLAALPPDMLTTRPRLMIYAAMIDLLAGKIQSAANHLQAAVDVAGEYADASWPGEVAAVQSLLAIMQDDQRSRVTEHARLALELLPPSRLLLRDMAAWCVAMGHYLNGEEKVARALFAEAMAGSVETGNVFVGLLALYVLGVSHLTRGYLNRADEFYRQMARIMDLQPRASLLFGLASTLYGDLLRERGDFEQAERFLHDGLTLGEQLGNPAFIIDGYIALARLQHARGDTESAFDNINRAEQLARQEGVVPHTLVQVEAYRVQFLTAQGRLAETEDWLAARRRPNERLNTLYPDVPFVRELENLTLARLLIAHGRSAEALALLDQTLQLPEAGGDLAVRVEAHALRALAHRAAGQPAEAFGALDTALALAEPEAFCRLFADLGGPIADLLHDYARARPAAGHEGYARVLLKAIEEPGLLIPAPRRALELPEPLNDREREILGLVAGGSTNQEIALRLNISLSTVKWYLYNLYGKLSVRNRTEAVASAREIGLIPA